MQAQQTRRPVAETHWAHGATRANRYTRFVLTGSRKRSKLPPQLARPWQSIARRLTRRGQPSLHYTDVVLWNWFAVPSTEAPSSLRMSKSSRHVGAASTASLLLPTTPSRSGSLRSLHKSGSGRKVGVHTPLRASSSAKRASARSLLRQPSLRFHGKPGSRLPKGVELGNVDLAVPVFGVPAEARIVAALVAMHAAGAPLIRLAVDVQEAAAMETVGPLKDGLLAVRGAILDMTRALRRLTFSEANTQAVDPAVVVSTIAALLPHPQHDNPHHHRARNVATSHDAMLFSGTQSPLVHLLDVLIGRPASQCQLGTLELPHNVRLACI